MTIWEKTPDHLNEVKTEILVEYGNTAYLRVSGKKHFKDVEGTRLWKLWYGTEFDVFCVRTLEHHEKQFNKGILDVKEFEKNLIELRDNLKFEFNKLREEKCKCDKYNQ